MRPDTPDKTKTDFSGPVFAFVNMFSTWKGKTGGMDLSVKQVKGYTFSN